MTRLGRKVALSTPMQSAHEFARWLNELEHDREVLKRMSENCRQRQQELSWEEKAKTMVEWYEKVVKK